MRLLALSPHIATEARAGGTLTWIDGRGVPLRTLGRQLLAAGRAACAEAGQAADGLRVGIAAVPLVAEVAARWGAAPPRGPQAVLTGVAPGDEAAFLAGHPLAVLVADDAPTAVRRAVAALGDAGVATCGALAALTAEAVETRLGAEGAALWQLARGEDRRVVFRHAARERPSASTTWTEFELRAPEPLLFAARALVDRVCAALQARGEAARALVLTCALAAGGATAVRVCGARDAADATTWTRLVRAALERVTLDDGVVGLALAVEAAREAPAPQADLFDRGAATAAAAARAVARLVEDGLGTVVRPVRAGHALPEHRVAWTPVAPEVAARTRLTERKADRTTAQPLERPQSGQPAPDRSRPTLVRTETPGAVAPDDVLLDAALTVYDPPHPLVVTTRAVRGHRAPVHYRERLAEEGRSLRSNGRARGQPLVTVRHAGGPDQIVGIDPAHGPVAREYWQCLTDAAELVLIFRDLAAAPVAGDVDGTWYLHGRWE